MDILRAFYPTFLGYYGSEGGAATTILSNVTTFKFITDLYHIVDRMNVGTHPYHYYADLRCCWIGQAQYISIPVQSNLSVTEHFTTVLVCVYL